MLFNSLSYGIFLPIVFAIYWAIPNKYRWILLLVSSYYFYMSWNPKYIILIFGTTLISYMAGLLMEKSGSRSYRKAVLVTALIICLGVLAVFKYLNFFLDSFTALLSRFAIQLHPMTVKLILPVGISFYTFQTLSYAIDVYKGKVKACRNFGVYAAFISFFPQLVAGPIERTENLLPQITSEKKFDYEEASYGLKLMVWGFFKKLVIADTAATYVDAAFSSVASCTGLDLFLALVFFSFQVYCDFSGYSDIAIGSARLLGIKLVKNFDSPYFSTSIREVWMRWHISLSTWFRDYVYIPLGGSRCSKVRRDVNLLITFLLSGLWHGANWTYVIWGGLNGLGQIIEEKLFGKKNPVGARKVAAWFGVAVFWLFSVIFFRADTISDAVLYIKKFAWCLRRPSQFKQTALGFDKPESFYCMFFMLMLMLYDFASLKRDVIQWLSSKKKGIRWAVYLLMIWVILAFMPPVSTTEFVYFQF